MKLLFIKVRCLINVKVSLEANLDGQGWLATLYHLLALTWGWRYFWKRGNIRKGYVDIEDLGTSVYFVFGFQENSIQSLFDFQLFFVVKRILKALFSFISWLLNFSDLPSYGPNLRKRYTLRLLSKCLDWSTPYFPYKVPPLIPSSISLDRLLLA